MVSADLKRRILVINTNPFDKNGMSTVIMNYFNYMDTSDMAFDFIVNEYIDPDFERKIINRGGRVFILKDRNRKPWNYVKKLREIASSNLYDIVHIHGNSATVYFDMMGVITKKNHPIIIVQAHGVKTSHPIIHKLLYSQFIRHVDVALAASKAAGDFLFRDRKRFTVVKNGIDIDKFKYSETKRVRIRKKLELENKQVLLHIGAFTEQKNHEFAVRVFYEAYKENNNLRLVLAGKGPLMDHIKSLVESLQIKEVVTFLGESSDTQSLYSMADAFIFPSSFEPLGIVMLEAQANGLPCIASDAVIPDVNISHRVNYISLDDENKWVSELLKKKERFNITEEDWNKSGYEIQDVVPLIRGLYIRGSLND